MSHKENIPFRKVLQPWSLRALCITKPCTDDDFITTRPRRWSPSPVLESLPSHRQWCLALGFQQAVGLNDTHTRTSRQGNASCHCLRHASQMAPSLIPCCSPECTRIAYTTYTWNVSHCSPGSPPLVYGGMCGNSKTMGTL